MKQGKMFFISLQKPFSFSRKSNLRILDFQISWRHQISKHKTRNTFYWITWEVNSLLMEFGQFMSYCKRKKIIKIFCQNCDIKFSSRPFCVCKELSTTPLRKWFFLSELLFYIFNIKTIKICPNQHVDLLRFLFTEDFLKLKRDWN